MAVFPQTLSKIVRLVYVYFWSAEYLKWTAVFHWPFLQYLCLLQVRLVTLVQSYFQVTSSLISCVEWVGELGFSMLVKIPVLLGLFVWSALSPKLIKMLTFTVWYIFTFTFEIPLKVKPNVKMFLQSSDYQW